MSVVDLAYVFLTVAQTLNPALFTYLLFYLYFKSDFLYFCNKSATCQTHVNVLNVAYYLCYAN